MLKKIIGIKNVGRFRNSTLGGDTSLAKHTLIYGANGFGKTTICTILRSLKTGDASHVLGRKTLGASELPNIQLLIGTGTAHFDGSTWTSPHHDLAIFDGIFITENVHSGDVVDTDQKRNLYRVIVGEAGVNLAEQESKLAGDNRTKAGEITDTSKAIQAHMPPGMTLETFVALPKADNIDQQIVAQEAKLVTIREAATIKAKPVLAALTLPTLPEEFTTLLATTIDDIAQDAEEDIQAHMAAHGMMTFGANWIVQGIDHAVGKSCPFCGQNIEGLPLIAAYRAVFSDRYKSLRNDITAMKTKIDQAFGETALAKLDTFAEQHRNGIEFWSRHFGMPVSGLDYPTSIAGAIHGLRGAAMVLIERKERASLEAIPVDDAFLKEIDSYTAEKVKAQTFNQAVRQVNTSAEAIKKQAGTDEVAAATAELARLKTVKTRHSPNVARLCDDLRRMRQEKDGIENRKTGIRQQLDQHTANVVKPYQTRINEFLDAFNAGFMIAETKHSYTGGVATSSYQLVINQIPIDIGAGNTPNHTPSFKNTLSAGDRSTLALAFFLAHLERDAALASKIVVLDDPFNSQDAFRRRQTIHEIIKIARKCAQVIVLSHDATFLKQLWEKCVPAERTAIALIDHGQQGSKIGPLDIEKACQGRTVTDIDDLQSYVTNGTGQHIDVIRKKRTVLETYMRSTYQTYFDDRDYLGEIVGKIRRDGQDHPAHLLYDELNEINDYTSQYHHGENVTDATPDQIDATELRGYAKRTLRIVNALQA